jgi:hypothetical protein
MGYNIQLNSVNYSQYEIGASSIWMAEGERFYNFLDLKIKL